MDDWKLIVPHEPNVKGGKPELYDLAKDPMEKRNLAGEAPGRGGGPDEEARRVVGVLTGGGRKSDSAHHLAFPWAIASRVSR